MAKKKTLGFETKAKTLEEINQEYSNHGFQAGHKGMLLNNTLELVDKTQKEITEHYQSMTQLRMMANKLQAQNTTPTAQPSTETSVQA